MGTIPRFWPVEGSPPPRRRPLPPPLHSASAAASAAAAALQAPPPPPPPPLSVPKNKSKAGNPQLVFGTAVRTKAVNVMNLVELSRFRGALAKTWLHNGTVLKVLRSKGKGGRNRTGPRVKLVWRGKVYNKVHALASVYAGPAPMHQLLMEVSATKEGSPVTQASQPAGAT
ncbi:hypothetical protein BU14_0033s0008 [Porphyra umbilicalis]|uniref:Uncharacterized protein n=1 Tax=Porphyra umbilicalis TaxID=2786 RepID=A0A1X6PIF6_PORUM|nr:hypothetical protein BU14_0033s0008 [Porphyra umbilicalis]|eukprot:OSX80664.1 hypothetical protein BU14_0033s0008 [Porphyra umbilicalis]